MWVREEDRGWDDGFWIGLNCQFRDLTGSVSVFLLGVPEEAFSSVFASTSLTLPLRLSILLSVSGRLESIDGRILLFNRGLALIS